MTPDIKTEDLNSARQLYTILTLSRTFAKQGLQRIVFSDKCNNLIEVSSDHDIHTEDLNSARQLYMILTLSRTLPTAV